MTVSIPHRYSAYSQTVIHLPLRTAGPMNFGVESDTGAYVNANREDMQRVSRI